ncbi:MAG: M16 family metallopeptidase, partial [Rhabdochlamydiaceae bacterium]
MSDLQLNREKFENGLVLLGNPVNDTETVAISGSIKAGALYDAHHKFGTAELVSRLLTRGTKAHTAGQISQVLEESGSALQFTNRDESVWFSGRCHHDALDQLLSIINECLLEASFPENEIDQARAKLLAEIVEEQDETISVAYKELMALIYGRDAPYGRNSLGVQEDIERLEARDLKLFYEQNYRPSRVVFAVTGRYDPEDFKSKIDRLFSSWSDEKRGSSEIALNFDFPRGNLSTLEMGHKSQVDLALGTRTVPRKSPSYYSLSLGNLILGRMGLYGRLGKNVRELKGIAYYCYSIIQARLYSGHLGIFAGVHPRNLEKAIEGITEEIYRITTEPLSETEILAAKRNALGSLDISLDTSIERVNVIHDIEYYDLGIDYL